MFDLSKNSFKNLTKIGFTLTFFVLTSACAHKAVAPANNDANGSSDVRDITPQPYSASEPVSKSAEYQAPVKKKSKKKKITLAKSKKKSAKQHNVMARTSSQAAPKPPQSQPPAIAETKPVELPAPDFTAPHSAAIGSIKNEMMAPPSTPWEHAQDYLAYAFMAIGAVGIVLIASRLERKRVKGRRKIVFN